MKKDVSIIVFWGAAWGITEATLGYALHLLPVNIGWLFWFPIAFYFMKKAYTQTEKLSTVIYTALIASGIKLVNLLMPVRIDYVINPAVSVILESIAICIAFKIVKSKGKELKEILVYLEMLIINITWRVLYVIYVLFLPTYLIKISPLGNWDAFLKFFALESVVNSLFIYTYYRLTEKKSTKRQTWLVKPNPVISFIVLCLSVVIQFII